MKIIIESTSKIVWLNGIQARIWEGETDSAIKIHCFITRVAIDKDEPRVEQFETELKEQRVPSAEIESYPMRLIL
jgi:hypothetical protein